MSISRTRIFAALGLPAANIVPTSTGAATAIGLVIPELAGRLEGFAARVPVLTGSMVQLTAEVESPTTVANVNELFAEAATTPDLLGILQYTEEPIVSSDVIKSSYSSILDAGLTIVAGETQVSARHLVRQRVGVCDSAGRARTAGARTGTRCGLIASAA